MSAVTENDLKELKELILSNQQQLETRLSTIQQDISDLRVSVGKIESTLQSQQPLVQKIPDLAEKVGELKNWKQIALTLGGALLGALFTYLAKSPKL